MDLFERRLSDCRQIPAVEVAFARLDTELPGDLLYHAKPHTEDVFREALFLAVTDQLTERDQELLAIAAAFHDTGFIVSREDNEEIGAAFAEETLRASGDYSDEEIGFVQQMILDTKVRQFADGKRQEATTRLSGYLLDADVANLGREDFFDRGELQRQEEGTARLEFLERTLKFLEAHKWHTAVADRLRQDQKLKNLDRLRELIAK